MLRRIFLPTLLPGRMELPDAAARHLRDVLRLPEGAEVEAFTTDGSTSVATFHPHPVASLTLGEVRPPPPRSSLTVATAVPKGDRADYLVEKLAELGVTTWVPLDTARAVVLPKGESKRERWTRIAQEAARQSHAPAVLQIAPLTPVADLMRQRSGANVWFCSTVPGHVPAASATVPSLILIGPEGGWTPEEEASFVAAGFTPVSLGSTVLRVETAAIVAAALALRPITP